MRLIALLSWYDEPLTSLAACLTSLRTKLGVDHLVALDGRYALYPSEQDVSPSDQVAALHAASAQLGMTADVIVPNGPWPGEVEKRTALFAYGLAAAEEGDWFIVMDSDQVVTEAPSDLKKMLAATDLDAAEVTFHDATIGRLQIKDFPESFPMRVFFRAQEIRVERHHAIYITPDERVLWCASQELPEVAALDLKEVIIDHRPQSRPPERLIAKNSYYAARDEAGIEYGLCRCGAQATVKMHGGWKRSKQIDGKIVGRIMTFCGRCATRQKERDRRKLLAMGIDPDSLRSSEYYGAAPR